MFGLEGDCLHAPTLVSVVAIAPRWLHQCGPRRRVEISPPERCEQAMGDALAVGEAAAMKAARSPGSSEPASVNIRLSASGCIARFLPPCEKRGLFVSAWARVLIGAGFSFAPVCVASVFACWSPITRAHGVVAWVAVPATKVLPSWYSMSHERL
jgi:hypothetical protein